MRDFLLWPVARSRIKKWNDAFACAHVAFRSVLYSRREEREPTGVNRGCKHTACGMFRCQCFFVCVLHCLFLFVCVCFSCCCVWASIMIYIYIHIYHDLCFCLPTCSLDIHVCSNYIIDTSGLCWVNWGTLRHIGSPWANVAWSAQTRHTWVQGYQGRRSVARERWRGRRERPERPKRHPSTVIFARRNLVSSLITSYGAYVFVYQCNVH